ncbi:4-hydroxythreonine-4-phosphate dehydrogenase PdxA [Pelagibacterales bacterium SAG-MED07]|nr:4-hydroxythreonine-4-phosphate dehydrogenase PdxA [Pelagibacterales bacterium SAG-MED07]
MSKNIKPILLVAGDPKSIFLEIFFKSLRKKKYKNPLILIVNKKILINQIKTLKYKFKLNQLIINQINYKNIDNKKINFIDVEFNNKSINKYIFESFEIALHLIKKNNNVSLINGPINKKKILNQKFLGITEYLDFKSKSKGKSVMLIFNKTLSVSPLTTHVPLKKVHSYINKIKIINHVKTIDEFYKKRFKIKPIIGITGLNPHCESNFLDSEEDKIISPAIEFLKRKKYKVTGPYSGDTIFLKNNYKKFNVIIGMYHDQVLAPIKSIFGFNAINVTLGLPFIRISPDHGPNYEMFLKNKSNPNSLIEAIKFLDN